jgi:hypothetical protein
MAPSPDGRVAAITSGHRPIHNVQELLERAVDFLDSIVVAAERNGSRGVKARSFPTASLPSRPHKFYFTGDDGAGENVF